MSVIDWKRSNWKYEDKSYYQKDFFMGRPWRAEYQGWIYHAIIRGNDKEYIFKESIDKGY